jgi:tripartite-type tricarboxylate transporter receptor subunit TctC
MRIFTIAAVSSAIVGAAVVVVSPHIASAQTYPTRPVTMIVPFAAGGPADTVGRIMIERMRATLGQPIIIENVAGANGSIGVGRAVRAAPDGYTIIAGTLTTHVLIGGLYSLPYDLLNDFTPIALLASGPLIVTARKNLPANSLQELISWLKANPEKATQGTAGVGVAEHVAGVLLQKQTGTRFQFVPCRGLGPAMQDLVAGQIDMVLADAATSLPQVQAGTIKALAVASKDRIAAARDIPTVDEAGLPGFYAPLWFGLWAPAGTPQDVVAKLNAAAVDALGDAAVRRRFAELGQEIVPSDQQKPEVLGAFQREEVHKWWPIIKGAGIKIE